MGYEDARFRINIYKMEKGRWSFGIGLSRWHEELYIYIYIFRWEITIGKMCESFLLDK